MTDHDPKLVSRLNRIEGQVRGISRMVAEGRYCIDILTQMQAVRAALTKVETAILQEHLGKCVEGAITTASPWISAPKSTNSFNCWREAGEVFRVEVDGGFDRARHRQRRFGAA